MNKSRLFLRFMKNKVLIPAVATALLVGFFSFRYIAGGDGNDNASTARKELVVTTVMKAIKEGHFSPRKVDDSLSYNIWHKMMDELDYEKKFFTKEEVAQLQAYEFKIDDELNAGSVEFFDKLNEIFAKDVDRAEKFEIEALQTPFTFNGNDSIQLAGERLEYVSEPELKNRWRTAMKYRVLSKYIDLKKAQEEKKANKDSARVAKFKSDAELEVEARESMKKNQIAYFKSWRKLDDSKRFTIFVNAITTSEDPHTDFFPPREKDQFDEMMSGTFVGIGAQLKEENEKIKVAEIITGSPCWKQGELKAGDEIMKVGQGNKEAEDITGMEIDQVVKKIRGEKGTEVRLTVKRIDGSIKVIPIIRDNVSREETFAKSAIIKSPAGPVGYIYLPEFYADFNHSGGRRCADDVAIEVQKLKNAGVTGIILDLRNNGGGSLTDVVDMGGLFIDQGPIVQVKSADADATTLRDGQRGTLYDGPLAIMVNGGSASASEIMAAAMQDYKRAVIVGSLTYGKGTVQKVIPLDEFLDPITRVKMMGSSDAAIGFLKITVQKFYRINGGSTQQRGVTPDITLPDPYAELDMGERKEKSSLKWDEIAPAKHHEVNAVNVPELAAASAKRVANNATFMLIANNAKEMKARQDDNVYSLNEVAYKKELDKSAAISKKMDELQKKGTPMAIVNPKEDMEKIGMDAASKEKNEKWIKNLQKDIYISETVNIVNDMSHSTAFKNTTPGVGMK